MARPSESPFILDDEDIEDLWRAAEIPVGQRQKFSAAIVQAANVYVTDKRTLSVDSRNYQRDQIEGLARNIQKWLTNETPQHMADIKQCLDTLDLETVGYLDQFEPSSQHEAPFWIVEGLTRDVLLRLYGNCCLGADIPRQGRRRPEGKRSKPVTKIKYAPPKGSIGRPREIALDMLVARLAYAYEEATGKRATRYSPFSVFLVHFLSKLGEAVSDVEDPMCLRRYLKFRATN